MRAGQADPHRAFFDRSPVGMYRTTVDGTYIMVNAALARLYGFETPRHLIETYKDIANQLYVDPRRRDDFARLVTEGRGVHNFDAEIRHRSGGTIWIREDAVAVCDGQGRVCSYEGTVIDITEQKRAEETVDLLVTAFNSVVEGVLIVDGAFRVCWANPAYSAITGYEVQELIGAPLALPGLCDDSQDVLERILGALRRGESWQGEQTLRRKNGDPFPAWLSVAAARKEGGPARHFVLVCTDVTPRKKMEARLHFHASYDFLTTLPNRRSLQLRLEQEIERGRETGVGLAVFYIDLDRFKPVNDRLGHAAGDQLLKLAAKRMRNSLRLSDTVGRLGGDEFLIIASDIVGRAPASYIAEKIRYSFSEPFAIRETEVYCTASVGIALYPEHGATVDDLITNADIAMYRAKENQPNSFCFFEAGMDGDRRSGIDLEGDLRRALLREEFLLHYQPKLDLVSGRITSAEALIRWRHPTLGLVPPGEFIPLAEKIGLIRTIGVWTLRTACYQMCRWLDAGSSIASVAVNLSPVQFHDEKLVGLVAGVLEETGVPAHAVELELTEGAIITDVERAIATMAALKKLGVRLAIDDFGTGYSSLAYLKHFPIDTLKIDRSFVTDLEHDATDQAIVSTIVELGRSLGVTIVAEGVETETQLGYLQGRGCGVVQGYLIGRPVDSLKV